MFVSFVVDIGDDDHEGLRLVVGRIRVEGDGDGDVCVIDGASAFVQRILDLRRQMDW